MIADEIKNLSFCVFDLETTGGAPEKDQIIEIGLVKVQGIKIIEQKSFLINPEIKIPIFIQRLTDITEDKIKNCPKIEDVIDEIRDFMKDSILVAHNTSFDVPFFNNTLKKLNRSKLENRSLCTNLMTRYLIPNLINSNLHYMCKVFKIKHENAHRALDDAHATAQLLIKFLNIFIEKNIKKINHLYYPQNKYELDRVHIKKNQMPLEDVKKLLTSIKTPFLFSFKGKEGVTLFSLPCINFKKVDIKYFEEVFKKEDWETFSVKLHAPFFQALVHFKNLYKKMNSQIKDESLKKLWLSFDKSNVEINKKYVLPQNFPLFLISNHLVPDQFILYSTKLLHSNQELIIRYPQHEKKLKQFLLSKVNKIAKQKSIKSPIINQSPLDNFINFYLKDVFENKKDEILFLNIKGFHKDSNILYEQINHFISKNPNEYDFPFTYL